MSLDLDNLTPQEEAFRDTLESAGMPTDADSLKTEWQAMTAASGVEITNTSTASPFWNLVTALVTTPVLWLVAFAVRYLMPSSYVKTASGAALDLLAWTYGITRKPAVKARGEITLTREDGNGELPVPFGTVTRTAPINGKVYRVITIDYLSLEPGGVGIPGLYHPWFYDGQTTLKLPVEAEEAGASYNLGAGYYAFLDSYLPGVTATNAADWLDTPGADEETDEALRLRIQNQFLAQGDWHTDAAYRAMIAEYAGIDVDRIFFDHDIPRGPGSADAYILYDAAATPTSQLADINDYIASEGHHGHGDDLVVFAVPDDPQDIVVTVYFHDHVPPEDRPDLLTTVEQLVGCAFRANSDYLDHVTQVRPEARNSMSLLAAEIHDYLPEVASVDITNADIVSALTVPRLNSLTVTDGDA